MNEQPAVVGLKFFFFFFKYYLGVARSCVEQFRATFSLVLPSLQVFRAILQKQNEILLLRGKHMRQLAIARNLAQC